MYLTAWHRDAVFRLLQLGSNSFTGSIPTNVGSLLNLQYLYLGPNPLSGTIPDQLTMLTALTYVEFGTGRWPSMDRPSR